MTPHKKRPSSYGAWNRGVKAAGFQDQASLFFDTAGVYGPFPNEAPVCEALATFGGRVVIATNKAASPG
jgi:hypothetical protein